MTCQLFCSLSLKALSVLAFSFPRSVLGQDAAKQFAMVDHADIRGLVTDGTSLHRGAGLSLVAGFIDRERPLGIIPLVNAGLA
ncbi:MAG: hypothetical protein P8166_04340, partial [Candidatus Thiodiazotropha sp.]